MEPRARGPRTRVCRGWFGGGRRDLAGGASHAAQADHHGVEDVRLAQARLHDRLPGGPVGPVPGGELVEAFREVLGEQHQLGHAPVVEHFEKIEGSPDGSLLDGKPAGFEPVDVRSGYNGNAMGAYVEFRDERVCFFLRTLARGTHSVSYRTRAEFPGKFSALPTKIYGMYAPELVGNADEFKLLIED